MDRTQLQEITSFSRWRHVTKPSRSVTTRLLRLARSASLRLPSLLVAECVCACWVLHNVITARPRILQHSRHAKQPSATGDLRAAFRYVHPPLSQPPPRPQPFVPTFTSQLSSFYACHGSIHINIRYCYNNKLYHTLDPALCCGHFYTPIHFHRCDSFCWLYNK